MTAGAPELVLRVGSHWKLEVRQAK